MNILKFPKKIIKYFLGEKPSHYWRYFIDRKEIKRALREKIGNKQLQFPSKIAILFIGTDKYIKFLPKYYLTIKKYFLPKTPKEFFVFTDKIDYPFLKNKKDIKIIKIEHLKWPYIVLRTYEVINSINKKLRGYSHVIFLDADMYLQSKISEKEFFSHNKPLFTVQHPNFLNHMGTFEKNPKSRAYVGENEDKSIYRHSVLFGGETKSFLKFSKELDKRIKEDLKEEIIAQWHDESHLNKYVIENKDLFHTYNLSYAYPEKRPIPKPFKKKMIHMSGQDPNKLR